MSGLTALLDTLLATRLAQRVDLVPLKSELEIAGPGAVTRVEEVTNDVRLTSRAALEQQLGVGLLKADQRGHGHTPARPDETVTLSLTARAVNAILEGQSGVTVKMIGLEPLLPHPQSPLPHLLAATLARTVANSGLFYESHLAQFTAGTRTLAELMQEPQARLNASVNPDAVLLVRQQLELLAVPVFRWGGEAWPGVPMEWEIHEKEWADHQEERQAAAPDNAVPRTWCTRLALTLPTLREVEAHISLAGATLQIHLAARENATRALLSECRAELPRRFEELGLQLIGLQIDSFPAASTAQALPEEVAARNTPGVRREKDRPSVIELSHANKNREPLVVARGYGDAADLIVQRAHEHGLYVHESPDLVKLLMHVNLDADIPAPLYVVIAEVLAWLYRLQRAEPSFVKNTSI